MNENIPPKKSKAAQARERAREIITDEFRDKIKGWGDDPKAAEAARKLFNKKLKRDYPNSRTFTMKQFVEVMLPATPQLKYESGLSTKKVPRTPTKTNPKVTTTEAGRANLNEAQEILKKTIPLWEFPIAQLSFIAAKRLLADMRAIADNPEYTEAERKAKLLLLVS